MDSTMSKEGASKTAGNKSHPVGKKPVALALQGGGSHGAFTWGVLDAFLASEQLELTAMSGTSAGSMNAVLAAYGVEQGGAEEARRLLQIFWERVAQNSAFSPLQPTLLDKMMGNNNLEFSPMFMGLDLMTKFFSPYQLNPFGVNPLKSLLEELIDFDKLRSCKKIGLYLSATNVRTCGLKVFHTSEVTVDAVLASACLPFLFKAVEIDGEHYWDGGYMGNPTLYPLIHQTQSQDIIIVQINPIERKEVPKTSTAILDRINEISFNSSLIHELRGLLHINKLIKANHLENGTQGLRHLHLHMVQDEVLMADLSYASKMNADYDFLISLRDAGRKAAQSWLEQHYETIGQDSTINIAQIGMA
jgi:NTE family protein